MTCCGPPNGGLVFLPFALLDADQHALGIDIPDFESDHLADAQSGAIGGHQRGAVLEAGNVIEEGEDLLLAEDDGQFVRTANAWEVLVGPGHFQGDQVEELHRGNILIDGFRSQLALVEQVELVLADGFQVQQLRTLAEVAGEGGDVVNVVALGLG
jgi:hypothetical protein